MMCSATLQPRLLVSAPDQPLPALDLEWLAANARGSFAMGCVDRLPRRKYHGLLTVRETPLGDPLHLLAEVGETITLGSRTYLLHNFAFAGSTWPEGAKNLAAFDAGELQWTYELEGATVHRALKMEPETDAVALEYQIEADGAWTIWLTPFLTARHFHTLSHENPLLRGAASGNNGAVTFQVYSQVPPMRMEVTGSQARYEPKGEWMRGVRYDWEHDRGYASSEDLYAPGAFKLTGEGAARFRCTASVDNAKGRSVRLRKPSPGLRGALEQAANPFLTQRQDGFHTVIAGYPWFGEWGRDTLILLEGLCKAANKPERQAFVLHDYANALHHGLVPNVLSSDARTVNPNSIDASLWYVRAVQQLASHAPHQADTLLPVCMDILRALKNGADHRVRVGGGGEIVLADGPWALTWMDAMIDGVPVTPRAGAPIEINALFYNALRFTLAWAEDHDDHAFVAEFSPLVAGYPERFVARYWNEERRFFADTLAGDGAPDRRMRPNQLWALGLPFSPVPEPIAAKALEKITTALLTPVGLRSLGPQEPGYLGRYGGDQPSRDRAYHQGTVWPWLLGAYADAAMRIWGLARTSETLAPTLERLAWHLNHEACLGQISEIFDGDAPHSPGGAPAQAWNVGELYRVVEMVTP